MTEFDYQWKNIPCKPIELSTVQRLTGLPVKWFKGKTILDAGAGGGRFTQVFSALDTRTVACDISLEGIYRCPAPRLIMDVTHPALNTLFDMVWSYGVVHHIQQYKKALVQLAQLVKPDGYLVLMVYRRPTTIEGLTLWLCYSILRHVTKYWTSEMKLRLCNKLSIVIADTHGWFDAINPRFNKLFTLQELITILQDSNLVPVNYTGPKNHIEIMFRKGK